MPLAPDLIDDLAVARLAAQRAGALIADAWRDGAAVRFKGPIDPVTEADLAAERLITGLIGARFPDDRIVAEEGGVSGPDGARRWLIDPLDGTTNFSHRLPRSRPRDGWYAVGSRRGPLAPGPRRDPGHQRPSAPWLRDVLVASDAAFAHPSDPVEIRTE